MSQEKVKIVRAIYEEWGKGSFQGGLERRDVPAMVELLSDDFELDLSGHPIPDFPDHGVGAEHVVDMLATYLSGFDDYTLRIVRLMEAGDEIVVLLHDSTRIHGSETVVERDLAHVWTVRATKLRRLRAYNAHKDALEAAGLFEQDAHADS